MDRVRGVIKIDVTFNGDATVDTTIDVIGQAKIDCSAENLAETDSLVTFPDAPSVGDCVGSDRESLRGSHRSLHAAPEQTTPCRLR